MKFEKTMPDFSPIIITLETELEVQALTAALINIVGHGLDGDFLFKLYEKLDREAGVRTLRAEGTVRLTRGDL